MADKEPTRTDQERRRLAEEEAFDALIRSATPPRPAPELFAAVLAEREEVPWRRWLAALWPEASLTRAASACAAALVLGVALGAALPPGVAPADEDAALIAALGEVLAADDDEEVS